MKYHSIVIKFEMFFKHQRIYIAFHDYRLHSDKLDILDKLRVTWERVRENDSLMQVYFRSMGEWFAFKGM